MSTKVFSSEIEMNDFVFFWHWCSGRNACEEILVVKHSPVRYMDFQISLVRYVIIQIRMMVTMRNVNVTISFMRSSLYPWFQELI